MKKITIYIYLSLILISVFVIQNYEYNKLYWLLLSILSNGYLILSFHKHSSLFHIFNSFFLWMGFWIKFLFSHLFFDLSFAELNSDRYLSSIDEAMIVSSLGIAGFLVSNLVNIKIWNYNINQFSSKPQEKVINFVNSYKVHIIIFFIITIIALNLLNYFFSIYQKGIVSNESINFLILSLFKWLLLFGLTSFSSVIIFLSLQNKKFPFLFIIISLIENFITSISMLSRAMFVNSTAILVGIVKYNYSNKLKNIKIKFLICFVLFVILFIISLFIVKDLRDIKYYDNDKKIKINEYIYNSEKKITSNLDEIFNLITNRFVGLEGVLAISSYENKSFNTLKKLFINSDKNEIKNFYSKDVKNESTHDIQTSKSNTYFIKVPGIVAFLYYSNSMIFVFFMCLFVGLFCSLFEKIIIKYSFGNIIFASLISQVLAYRLSNFGFMPANTYLLLITILINLVIIYISYEIIKKFKN